MELSIDNFGTIIAFLLPGLVAMAGIGYFNPTVRRWFGSTESEGSTIGGAVLLLFAALSVGLVSNALREIVIDRIHNLTGIPQPELDFSLLDNTKYEEFQGIIANYFQHYQFYGNMFLCILFFYVSRQASRRMWPWPPGGVELAMGLLLTLLWYASRSELAAFDLALNQLLSAKGG